MITDWQLRCGHCRQPVPDGTARIVVNYHAVGEHQLFCPGHVPAGSRPWKPHADDWTGRQ